MHLSRFISKVRLPKSTPHSIRIINQTGSHGKWSQRIRHRASNHQYRYTSGDHHQPPSYIVRPYSDSLPSEGYEWCTRCSIRCHNLQKKIGYQNACLDSPRLFGLGICSAAKKYWQKRVYSMVALATICFVPMNEISKSEELDHGWRRVEYSFISDS